MSEELSNFKKKRTAVRSSLTKLLSKIEGKINNENEPVDQFEAFIDQLNDKESNLSLLNTLIEDRLSVDTITEDIEASEEIKEKIIFWKTKLSSKIRRINSDSSQIDTVSRNIQVIDSNSFECMNINLPKLHINKYSGNYSEWLDFYNLFESSIHNNNRLSKVDKFNYLKSYLCGNALACINGFPISDDNYDRALDSLKDRFGNKNMLINAHLSNLLNLTPVRNPTDIVGLRNLYDRAETQIRSLESLGVKGESYSNLLRCLTSLAKLCAFLGLPFLSKLAFRNQERKLLKATERVAQENINAALSEIKGSNSFTKCGISIDGTWQRRGYSSLNGCVSAISVDTGKILDIEVMTQYCHICAKGNSQSSKHVCSNYKGSAGNMEVVGAYRIFERSNVRNVQYNEYYGDGDSKGYESVKNFYGINTVTKLECIGHVQKRVGGGCVN
ncbi:uncharacterized protein TNCV_4029481 [Trichonephila clavipes]|nr:uncharacterized protein TNCV_4029481 [Trichonephila clavipes]